MRSMVDKLRFIHHTLPAKQTVKRSQSSATDESLKSIHHAQRYSLTGHRTTVCSTGRMNLLLCSPQRQDPIFKGKWYPSPSTTHRGSLAGPCTKLHSTTQYLEKSRGITAAVTQYKVRGNRGPRSFGRMMRTGITKAEFQQPQRDNSHYCAVLLYIKGENESRKL